jgi:hypothetical protein
MLDVAKFYITAHEVSNKWTNKCFDDAYMLCCVQVSGSATGLEQDLADTLDVVGRISPDTVWDYISKMKKTGTKVCC